MAEDPLDAMDEKGRLKRGIIALAVGIFCAVSAYGALYAMARPDSYEALHHASEGAGGAWKFVWYFTGLAFIVPFILTHGILANLAKKRWLKEWERSQIPEAKQIS